MTDEIVAEQEAHIKDGADKDTKTKPKRQKRTPKKQAAAATAVKEPAIKAPDARSRRYSNEEKAKKLLTIENQTANGSTSLKDAIKQAGISEQTYYHWKRTSDKPQPAREASPGNEDILDLLKLEQENQRLRNTLAQKLRAENAQLRKKLGLD